MCTLKKLRDSSQTLVNDRWCINLSSIQIRILTHLNDFCHYKEKNIYYEKI